MTQMDILTKHVIGSGFKNVNAAGASGGKCIEDEKFEAMYKEAVQFLDKPSGGFSSYLSKVGRESKLEQGSRWKLERSREKLV
ncbi:hypothetical protein MTR67_022744 [Solanum verrucosum]|uniref:Uncharacterized protein n=1 Tax=Solanum verrucosum TaxID=315347 RepID=A0AAF0R0L6_SOLVR|nr:hypothetical protein MTR67_022744 [Solanum verrucosum]